MRKIQIGACATVMAAAILGWASGANAAIIDLGYDVATNAQWRTGADYARVLAVARH